MERNKWRPADRNSSRRRDVSAVRIIFEPTSHLLCQFQLLEGGTINRCAATGAAGNGARARDMVDEIETRRRHFAPFAGAYSTGGLRSEQAFRPDPSIHRPGSRPKSVGPPVRMRAHFGADKLISSLSAAQLGRLGPSSDLLPRSRLWAKTFERAGRECPPAGHLLLARSRIRLGPRAKRMLFRRPERAINRCVRLPERLSWIWSASRAARKAAQPVARPEASGFEPAAASGPLNPANRRPFDMDQPGRQSQATGCG